jgi:hypothetical protein
MTWVETDSDTFTARHEERDAADAERVLAQLEYARGRLEERFPVSVGPLAVVLHGTSAQLTAAEPWLAVQRALTEPAGRRYLVGWTAPRELHVLAPRLLAHRASNVEGSLEMLMLAPSALLARRYLGANHRGLPPPFGPRRFARYLRWAWLVEGAAQWFSGQARHVRPAVARRLHEGSAPAFPPGRRDAALLGGTVFALLAREEGEAACVRLACGPHPRGAGQALTEAFGGRGLRHSESAWRAHLARLAEPGDRVPRRARRRG